MMIPSSLVYVRYAPLRIKDAAPFWELNGGIDTSVNPRGMAEMMLVLHFFSGIHNHIQMLGCCNVCLPVWHPDGPLRDTEYAPQMIE